MTVEKPRGCGYRKVNGLYLCGEGTGMTCDRLPFKLDICPACGGGVHFSRAWRWLDWDKYAGDHNSQLELNGMGLACRCPAICPVCWPLNQLQPYGLLWIGEKFYSPEAFIRESLQMGISRRIPFTGNIPHLPKHLKLNETWVLFAHKHVIHTGKDVHGKDMYEPAVFHAFRPSGLELLIWTKDATPDRIAELEKAGVTPIVIPDGDPDHDPASPIGLPKAEKESLESTMVFKDLRSKLGKG